MSIRLHPSMLKVFPPVDPGVAGIAVTRAGKKYSGAHRQGRQASPSPPAQQTAKEADSAAPGENCKELSGREARFATPTSRVISKQIARGRPTHEAGHCAWKN